VGKDEDDTSPVCLCGGGVVVVCGGVWWCVVVCGGVWWCVVVCGGVWWCVVVCGGVWWCVVVCGGGGGIATARVRKNAQRSVLIITMDDHLPG
jgi:hypothetical protein